MTTPDPDVLVAELQGIAPPEVVEAAVAYLEAQQVEDIPVEAPNSDLPGIGSPAMDEALRRLRHTRALRTAVKAAAR